MRGHLNVKFFKISLDRIPHSLRKLIPKKNEFYFRQRYVLFNDAVIFKACTDAW